MKGEQQNKSIGLKKSSHSQISNWWAESKGRQVQGKKESRAPTTGCTFKETISRAEEHAILM